MSTDNIQKAAIIRGVSDVLVTSIKYGCIALCFYFTYKGVACLAGRTTESNITFAGELATTLSFSQPLTLMAALLICLGGISYGIVQKRQKQRVIAHFESRKRKWEETVDPGRKSSQLNTDGTTRKEDL